MGEPKRIMISGDEAQVIVNLMAERDAATARAERAEAAIQRVRELHAPQPYVEGSTWMVCRGCDSEGMEAECPEWPCRTIAALDSTQLDAPAPTVFEHAANCSMVCVVDWVCLGCGAHDPDAPPADGEEPKP